ncbi:hypothetical protein C3737_05340 [Aeromonas jandaei]|uniref:hypothetical protein n=1 Tax=Aeromonas jandaei TaxID=650 RepID=UPI000CE27ABF|nr:hypothetical protein [Aeromonas jandaei]PPA31586.1 hypothetical protein C3737_05340 [Aeromonas jandaei]
MKSIITFMFIEPMIKGSASLMLLLSLTLSSFVYAAAAAAAAAYDTYRLESQEIKGKNRICYYENARGNGHTITLPKSKQCKRYIKVN